MDSWRGAQRLLLAMFCFTVAITSVLWAQAAQVAQEGFQPQVGQAGKDVVWVPTPPVLVEKMLDMAKVTPDDYVMDLGSGDGRNVIAAAKRGARALGVEFNPNMVALSRQTAAKEGVSDKATFVEGDMFEADISKATVLALFLLPDNLRRLTPKFLELKPGTRIVGNTFGIEGWAPDETDTAGGDCGSWCQSLLWIVPAKVAGVWRLPKGELALSQSFQVIAGTLTVGGTSSPIVNGKLRGDQISFSVGGAEYSGRVSGDSMGGTVKSGSGNSEWSAARASK
jgi:SAM-dependent methyltransferase